MIDFDGTADWGNIRGAGPVIDAINSAAQVTICGWLNMDSNASSAFYGYSINNGGVATGNSRFGVEQAAAGLQAVIRAPDGDPVESQNDGGAGLGTGALVHVAIIADVPGDTITFYRNGVQTASNAVTFGGATFSATGSASAGIMAGENGGSGFSNGRATDWRAYTRALTAAEILTIWTCKGHDGITDGLVARYPMWEVPPGATPASTPDVTINARAATLVSSPPGVESPMMKRRRFH